MVKRKSTFGEIRSKFLVVHPDIDQEKEELRNVLIETSDGCIACPMVCLSKSEGGRIWPTKGPHPDRATWRETDEVPLVVCDSAFSCNPLNESVGV